VLHDMPVAASWRVTRAIHWTYLPDEQLYATAAMLDGTMDMTHTDDSTGVSTLVPTAFTAMIQLTSPDRPMGAILGSYEVLGVMTFNPDPFAQPGGRRLLLGAARAQGLRQLLQTSPPYEMAGQMTFSSAPQQPGDNAAGDADSVVISGAPADSGSGGPPSAGTGSGAPPAAPQLGAGDNTAGNNTGSSSSGGASNLVTGTGSSGGSSEGGQGGASMAVKVGASVGSLVGALLVAGVCVGGIIYWRRRTARQQGSDYLHPLSGHEAV
jgi:hypothetical protein